MAEQDILDGEATFERLGRACDRFADAGYPSLAAALAGRTRERRGQVRKAQTIPFEIGHELMRVVEEAERLLREIEYG